MARGFNKVIIMGNLTREPDVRTTPNRQKVARITVAVTRQWKNKATGELDKQTDFIPVVAWSFLADLCERYLRKGNPVLVEGRLRVRDYDDPKTGTRKWVTEVIAENITMLSSGRREDEYGGVPAPRASSYSDGPSRPQSDANEFADSSDVGSLRDDIDFPGDFPLDISGDDDGDVDVPF